MAERVAQQAARGAILLPLHERHHHLLVGRPQRRLRGGGQLAQRHVVRRHLAATIQPVERVAQLRHTGLGLRRGVAGRGGDQRLRHRQRQRRELPLVRRAVGFGSRLDGGLQRAARGGVVAEPLVSEREHRPQRGNLVRVGGPPRGRL
jgi:hypothetical protein